MEHKKIIREITERELPFKPIYFLIDDALTLEELKSQGHLFSNYGCLKLTVFESYDQVVRYLYQSEAFVFWDDLLRLIKRIDSDTYVQLFRREQKRHLYLCDVNGNSIYDKVLFREIMKYHLTRPILFDWVFEEWSKIRKNSMLVKESFAGAKPLVSEDRWKRIAQFTWGIQKAKARGAKKELSVEAVPYSEHFDEENADLLVGDISYARAKRSSSLKRVLKNPYSSCRKRNGEEQKEKRLRLRRRRRQKRMTEKWDPSWELREEKEVC